MNFNGYNQISIIIYNECNKSGKPIMFPELKPFELLALRNLHDCLQLVGDDAAYQTKLNGLKFKTHVLK